MHLFTVQSTAPYRDRTVPNARRISVSTIFFYRDACHIYIGLLSVVSFPERHDTIVCSVQNGESIGF